IKLRLGATNFASGLQTTPRCYTIQCNFEPVQAWMEDSGGSYCSYHCPFKEEVGRMGADTSFIKRKNGRNSMDKTTKGKGYRLGCRPGQKDPRTQASDRAWIEKLATGKNRGESNSEKGTKEEIRVG